MARISNEEDLEDFMLYYEVPEADKPAIRQEWRNEHSTQERGLGAWILGGAVGGFVLGRLLRGRCRPGCKPAWQPGMGRRSVEMTQYNNNNMGMGYAAPYAAVPQPQPFYVPPMQAQYGQSGPAYAPPKQSPFAGAGGFLQNLLGKIRA